MYNRKPSQSDLVVSQTSQNDHFRQVMDKIQQVNEEKSSYAQDLERQIEEKIRKKQMEIQGYKKDQR